MLLEPLLQFLPVALVQDRLGRDEVLSGESGDVIGHCGNQGTPGWQFLEVIEVMVFQVLHQQVPDHLRIEQPGAGHCSGQLCGCCRFPGAERSIEPDDHLTSITVCGGATANIPYRGIPACGGLRLSGSLAEGYTRVIAGIGGSKRDSSAGDLSVLRLAGEGPPAESDGLSDDL